MTTLALARWALAVSAAGLLAACSGSGSAFWAQSAFSNRVANLKAAPPILIPAKLGRNVEAPNYKVSGPLLYVTNFDSPPYDAVPVYDAERNNPSPLAIISADVSDPGGDCIDAHGTLYVASEPVTGLGWISEYALGKTEPLRVITQGINAPAFCAVDGDENLWVTNFGNATVTEYLEAATTPHLTLTKGLTAPDGIAIDHDGDLYVGNLEPHGTSNVQVYAPGKTTPSRTITDGITWPIGIAIDGKGTLYVTNDVSPCNIEEYRAGQSKPYRTITDDIDGPVALTFAKDGRLYEVNQGRQGCTNNGPWPAILEFRPRARLPSKRMINSDLHTPVGVAYYPPLLP